MIIDGERRSRERYNSHSSAMAQVYNHMILPLASTRDRVTQIRWGIADYQASFGIKPEGMWLPETAADNETLELLAANGIKFTVLAPHQCKRIRPLKSDEANKPEPTDGKKPEAEWTNTADASVDTTRPYLVRFKSGSSIAVFFYNGPASRAIAFEGLLNSGDNLVGRLRSGFKDSTQPQLVHVATDGESYGHHHKHGEMALAYALRLLEKDKDCQADKLRQLSRAVSARVRMPRSSKTPRGAACTASSAGAPTAAATAASPAGTRSGARRCAWRSTSFATPSLRSPSGRRRALQRCLGRTRCLHPGRSRSQRRSLDRFFRAHQAQPLSDSERIRALELMEMQRHAQLMYTSCGWFFDDIGGIETVQVIAYAARVLQLAEQVFGNDAASFEPAFLARLAEAKSNDPKAGDGAQIYKKCVTTMELHLEQVAAHYAISSVFSSFADETDLFCFHVRRISYDIYTSGRGRLALGRAHIASAVTGHAQSFSFAVLHFGDQNITAAVKVYDNSDARAFSAFAAEAADQVARADFPEVIRLLDRYYGHADYSLTSLFTDEQRRIVQIILNSTLWDIENSLTTIYQDHASLLHYLSQAGLPKPPALNLAASFAVNAGLRRVLEGDPIDQAQLRSYLALAKADQVPLDTTTLAYYADQRMKRAMLELNVSSGSPEILDRALTLAHTITELPFELNLWQAQNLWYEILRNNSHALTMLEDDELPRWKKDFDELGRCLSFDIQAIRAEDELATAAAD